MSAGRQDTDFIWISLTHLSVSRCHKTQHLRSCSVSPLQVGLQSISVFSFSQHLENCYFNPERCFVLFICLFVCTTEQMGYYKVDSVNRLVMSVFCALNFHLFFHHLSLFGCAHFFCYGCKCLCACTCLCPTACNSNNIVIILLCFDYIMEITLIPYDTRSLWLYILTFCVSNLKC